jgi:hypothetical protein
MLLILLFGIAASADKSGTAIFVEVRTSTFVAAVLANIVSRPCRLADQGHRLGFVRDDATVSVTCVHKDNQIKSVATGQARRAFFFQI